MDVIDRAGLAKQVQAKLRTSLNLRVPVSLSGPESLPRFENEGPSVGAGEFGGVSQHGFGNWQASRSRWVIGT